MVPDLKQHFVTFYICGKEYGTNIEQVHEVIRMKDIIPIPDTSSYVEGIINMREKIIPVINMRKKMKLQEIQFDRKTCIIISAFGNDKYIGLIVDRMGDLVFIDGDQISPLDEAFKEEEYLHGIARLENRIILIVNFSEFLSLTEKKSIENVVADKVEIRNSNNRD